MLATQGALFTQGARRWTDEQEAHRLGHIAAGCTPYLFRYWSSTPSAQLEAALAEYRTWPDDEFLASVCVDLETELEYRS